MRILADSSVWIDYLNGLPSPQADRLDLALMHDEIAMGDLIMMEILQGLKFDRRFEELRIRFTKLPMISMVETELAVEAARNYRSLRVRGITIRKTIDTLIATRCIVEGRPLLYGDREFDPFVEHLGLRRVTV